MNTRRLALLGLPLFVLTSSTAFAQTTDDGACNTPKVHVQTKAKPKAKAHAAKAPEPVAPAPAATDTTVQEEVQEPKEAEVVPPEPAPAPAAEVDTTVAPPVSTTTTTVAEARDIPQSAPVERRKSNVMDRWSAEPLVGYGSNNFRVGVGGRAGYTFDKVPVYVGATFMWHNGDSGTVVRALSVTETSQSFYYPALEVGYDLDLGPVLVRPYVGAGVLFIRDKVAVNGFENVNTQHAFMPYPGVTAHYTLPNTPVYVGADSRVLVPVVNKGASFQAFAVAGLSM
jgi:hypothetical protein